MVTILKAGLFRNCCDRMSIPIVMLKNKNKNCKIGAIHREKK